jgi:hypothetical protein
MAASPQVLCEFKCWLTETFENVIFTSSVTLVLCQVLTTYMWRVAKTLESTDTEHFHHRRKSIRQCALEPAGFFLTGLPLPPAPPQFTYAVHYHNQEFKRVWSIGYSDFSSLMCPRLCVSLSTCVSVGVYFLAILLHVQVPRPPSQSRFRRVSSQESLLLPIYITACSLSLSPDSH